MTKIVAFSDTHNQHEQVEIPECDFLLFTGDMSFYGELSDLRKFVSWFDKQPAKHKIMIAGNHDWCFQEEPIKSREIINSAKTQIHYLQDEFLQLDGLKFWGSPWSVWYHDWAFNPPDDKEAGSAFLYKKWQEMPEGIDILMVHGPPYGVLDRALRTSQSVGCPHLLNRINVIKPTLACFGHLHECYGMKIIGDSCFINSSTCGYPDVRPKNKPVELDWNEVKNWIKEQNVEYSKE